MDRELDAASLARLDAHTASCAACRAERASMVRVDRLLQDAFSGHPFDERLVREIVRMAESRQSVAVPVAAPRGAIVKFRAGGLVAAAAAAVVLVSIGVGLFGERASQPEPAAPRAVLAKAYGADIKVGTNPAGEAALVHEDEVVLNRSGAGSLVLEDGTRVDLRPDTSVVLRRERDGGVSVVLHPEGAMGIAGLPAGQSSGEVYCEVAKQHGHPFRVLTNALKAEVVGTRFLVRATGRESSVAVFEGRVLVASGPQQQRILSRDQEAVFAASDGILVARPLADARAQLSWNKRVLDSLPAPVLPTTAPVNSTRPTLPPIDRTPPPPTDLDRPVEGPKSNKRK